MLIGQLAAQLAELGLDDEQLEAVVGWAAAHPLLIGQRVRWSSAAAELAAGAGQRPSEAAGVVAAICEPRGRGLSVGYLVRFDEPIECSVWKAAEGEPIGRRLYIDADWLSAATSEPSSGCYDVPMGDGQSVDDICNRLAELGVPETALRPIRLWKAAPRFQVGDRVRWSDAVLSRGATGVAASEQGEVEAINESRHGDRFTTYMVRWRTKDGYCTGYQPPDHLALVAQDKGATGELQSA